MSFKYYFSKLLTKMHPTALKRCQIHKTSKVGHKSNFIDVKVGRYTYFGNNNSIQNAEFGSFCSIASFCAIGGGNHPKDYFSTSPIFYGQHNVFKKHFAELCFEEAKKTVIGNDVWIGENVFIKAGITIGDGAIVGTHSVVTKDVPPYAIIAGVPGKIIGFRFDEETIMRFLSIQWWNKDDAIIEEIASSSKTVSEFIERFELIK